jgi:polyphosphate kinase
MDYSDPKYYCNREMSWLEFNERVLEEAYDKTNPLFERLKFLAITASNMDEFFMIRVSGIADQADVGYIKRDISGLLPKQQLEVISQRVHQMSTKQYNCLNRSIMPLLEKEGISFVKFSDLNEEQARYVEDYFNDTIYPILTPMAIDQSRPFPLLANKSLNIILQLDAIEDELYAVVQIPTVVARIFEIKACEGKQGHFIFLEEIIKQFAGRLFQGHTIRQAQMFRITRNSDLTIDEEDSEDLLEEIEKSIKKRKWGDPVRLEIDKNMDEHLEKVLIEFLELEQDDIYKISGPLDLTVWFSFISIEGYADLKDKPMPAQQSVDFIDQQDYFEVIKKGDVLVHHPYESFDCVINFIKMASVDPQVLAIKQTLYRVSGNSPIVAALIQAAENGKQVTVVVELKARFDEENNINWARKLEKAGCHVVYGLVGLKTHCKAVLVVRKEDEGIRRYVHLGTGNYNDKTAKTYTDLGMFTCKESFGADVSALFNVLTGYSQPPQWREIAVAPTNLRSTFLNLIENETQIAKSRGGGHIIAKMNSLVDGEIIRALYRASSAGVKIELIIRGICCLKVGIPGVSDNITVISIIGRFLEHSRIYYFENGGKTKVYLASADWMNRNLDRRVEVLFAVPDEKLKQRIMQILDTTLSDTVKSRVQKRDGSYEHTDRRGKEYIHSQNMFYDKAVNMLKRVTQDTGIEGFKPIYHKSEE